jgi:hypothetical protein
MVRVFVALVILAGLALPAVAQSSAGPSFVGPDGEKQFGPYTWVWKSRRFRPVQGPHEIRVSCPAGDVVISGGYEISSHFVLDVYASRPGNMFEGWVVDIQKVLDGGTSGITVYASCIAPGSNQ